MAALIPEIVGHDRIISNWLKCKDQERMGGVYLFSGPSGIGKKMTAWALAQAFLCERDRQGCGLCPSCLKVAKHQSENVFYVEPSGAMIKMEQAHEILKYLSLKSWSGRRVIIVDGVDRFHPSAANSLLKTLEDPPPETLFFLIAPSVSAVLPTLRSRCQVFSFYPVSELEMKKKVQAPDWVLRAARGSFEKLEQFQEESSTQLRHQAAEILEGCLLNKDFLTDDSWRDPIKERGLWPRFIMYWNYLLRDGIYIKLKKNREILNNDMNPFLEKLSLLPLQQLLIWQEGIQKWENELLINRDAQLQMECLSIETHRGQTRGYI